MDDGNGIGSVYGTDSSVPPILPLALNPGSIDIVDSSTKRKPSKRASASFGPDSDDEYEGEYQIQVHLTPRIENDSGDDSNEEEIEIPTTAIKASVAASIIAPSSLDDAPPLSKVKTRDISEVPTEANKLEADDQPERDDSQAGHQGDEAERGAEGDGGSEYDSSEYSEESEDSGDDEKEDGEEGGQTDDRERQEIEGDDCSPELKENPFGPRGPVKLPPAPPPKEKKEDSDDRKAALNDIKAMMKSTTGKWKKGRTSLVVTDEDVKKRSKKNKGKHRVHKRESYDQKTLRKVEGVKKVDIYAVSQEAPPQAPRRSDAEEHDDDFDHYENDPRATSMPNRKASLDDPRVSYEELVRINKEKVYGELSWKELEMYLSEEEFLKIFKMDRVSMPLT